MFDLRFGAGCRIRRKMSGITRLLTRLLALLVLSDTVMSAGYYLPNQDAFATAKGNAYVATADTAAAVHYNPAGLTQLRDSQAIVGVYAIRLGNEARINGTKYSPRSEWQAVPHVYYAQPFDDRITLGIGLNSPFGLGNDWGQGTPFRTVVTEARLRHPSATLALGYKIDNAWSIGVSLSINYVELKLEQGLGFFPLDYLSFKGDGISASGSLSLRWQPRAAHAFGLVVASGTSLRLDGDIESNALSEGSARLEFMTPMRIAVGYSFRPTPRWNLEANIEWLDWDSLNTLKLKGAMFPPSGVVPLVFNWQSNFIYELGLTYRTGGGYILAIGYDYNGNSQPDETYQPGVADADRHWFNTGIGKHYDDWMWFLSYQFGYSNRTVRDNPPNPIGATTNGEYKARHHAVVLSWGQNF